MHPAPSVIGFTVLSGLGFGLIFWLGLGATGATGLGAFLWCLLAGGAAVIGLLASTFHLGHPERAMKAFSQWRSSWLSREGVLAVATLLVFGLYTLLWAVADMRLSLLGGLTSGLAFLTVFATAMIYAQLKTVPRWHTRLTPIKFLLFMLAIPALMLGYLGISLVALVALAVVQLLHWRAGDAGLIASGSTPETATGLGAMGQVRLLEAPHTGPNYLLTEMVFKVGRNRAQALRLVTLIVGFAIPVLILLLGLGNGLSGLMIVLAVATHLIGTVASRWLFFAEAEHVVGLYYGQR